MSASQESRRAEFIRWARFSPGKEGCARREREESGVISKAGLVPASSPQGQCVQAAGSPGCGH